MKQLLHGSGEEGFARFARSQDVPPLALLVHGVCLPKTAKMQLTAHLNHLETKWKSPRSIVNPSIFLTVQSHHKNLFMNRALAIIFMTDEEPVVAKAVASIYGQMREDDSLLLLHNGMVGQRFFHKYAELPRVRYFETEENLGVAGGRNYLLRQPECRDAGLIFFIDSDAIAPSDYLDRMTEFMVATPDVGVAGPVVLDYQQIKGALDKAGFAKVFDALEAPYYDADTAALERMFAGRLTSSILDHVGTNPDWAEAYLDNADTAHAMFRALGVEAYESFSVSLKYEKRALETLNKSNQKIRVTNIAGCCQVFSGALLKQIGDIYDLYSPYGHEDVDFCLKAIQSGKVNYTTNTTYLIHRTDQRHAARARPQQLRRKQINESRVRTILEYRWRRDGFPAICYNRVLRRGFSGYLKNEKHYPLIVAQMRNELLGVKAGANQLALKEKESFGQAVREGLQAYGDDFGFYKLLSAEAVRAARLDTSLSEDSARAIKRKMLPRKSGEQTLARFDSLSASRLFNRNENFQARRGTYKSEKLDKISTGQKSVLRSFRDAHQGRRCFIIGNGPSLKKVDFNLLRDEITIGVNGIFYMFDDIGFAPTYYVVEDNHVIDDNIERIVAFPATAKFFPAKYQKTVGPAPNHHYLPTDWEFYFKSSPYHERPRFSRDLSEVAYVGQTVTYLNLQLAHYMGCSEVFLIGVDFDYKVPSSSKIDGLTIVSQEDDPNHFHPEYFGKGKKWHFPKLENCEKVYRHARQIYEEDGRSLIDATIGGKLEVYEKRDFYELFDTPLRLQKPNAPLISFIKHVLTEALNGPAPADFQLVDMSSHDAEGDLDTILSWYGDELSKNRNATQATDEIVNAIVPERVRVLTAGNVGRIAGGAVSEAQIDVFVGLHPLIETSEGAHIPTPELLSLTQTYGAVYFFHDIVVGVNGAMPRIFEDHFGLSLDALNVDYMNPRIALALAGGGVTKQRTISTNIYTIEENVFGLPAGADGEALDFSLVGALLELRKLVAVCGDRLYFPG